ncbi:hypothetical protein [Actinomyces weissii]|uniref:Uncharacterized protein n=1 Tax=Actinomyces weissii TaxID=675090 RepID=A0A7T7S2V1_9ACTO|nr:hypothetical protein [Actinomyces weissii]QQM67992.1 hypothetical protein JG540_03820 [Actinomyces weissii]
MNRIEPVPVTEALHREHSLGLQGVCGRPEVDAPFGRCFQSVRVYATGHLAIESCPAARQLIGELRRYVCLPELGPAAQAGRQRRINGQWFQNDHGDGVIVYLTEGGQIQ